MLIGMLILYGWQFNKMITFKEYILIVEEFRGKGIDGIFKNPTKEEMSKIPASARGWISKDGDLYVAKGNTRMMDLHYDVLKRMVRLYKDDSYKFNDIKDDLANRFGVTIQRIERENAFAVGESEGSEVSAGKPKKYMKLARKKNPHIIFRPEPIDGFDIIDYAGGAAGDY